MSTTVTGSKRHLNINADEFAGDLNGTVNTATTALLNLLIIIALKWLQQLMLMPKLLQ